MNIPNGRPMLQKSIKTLLSSYGDQLTLLISHIRQLYLVSWNKRFTKQLMIKQNNNISYHYNYCFHKEECLCQMYWSKQVEDPSHFVKSGSSNSINNKKINTCTVDCPVTDHRNILCCFLKEYNILFKARLQTRNFQFINPLRIKSEVLAHVHEYPNYMSINMLC